MYSDSIQNKANRNQHANIWPTNCIRPYISSCPVECMEMDGND